MKLWEIKRNGKGTISGHRDENGKYYVILPNGEKQPCVNRYMTVLVAEVNGFDPDPVLFWPTQKKPHSQATSK